MDVLILSEERLDRTPDGRVWGPSSYKFWSRYLEVFDGVCIVARVRDVAAPTGQNTLATGDGVTVHAIPHHLGPLEYVRVAWQVRRAVRGSYTPGQAVIMRLGCHFAQPLYRRLMRHGAPYGVEVVGDPYDVFAPGVVSHPLRPLFRWWFTRLQQRYCQGASAAAYVTQRTLQQRYPSGAYAVGVSDAQIDSGPSSNSVLATHYSSVALDESTFRTDRAPRRPVDGPFRLVTVGSLAQLYKGTAVLLEAVAQCTRRGLDVTLTIVGDGKYRESLEGAAVKQGIAGRVAFAGAVPGPDAVKAYLDDADLFVLPSLTEGLPRALIEAMARGLPCIASAVGGIPELLAPDDLFPPARADALAGTIAAVMGDASRRERMSIRNVAKAEEFLEPVLRERRVQFYRHLRRQTEEWMVRRPGIRPGSVPGRATT